MLATQLNPLITSNAVKRNGIIRLTKYLCNQVNDRRIVIVLNLDVVCDDYGTVIGDPIAMKEDGTSDAPESAAHAAPAPAAAAAPPAVSPYAARPAVPSPYGAAAPQTSPTNPYARRAAAPAAAASPYASFSAGGIAGAFQPISSLNPYNNRWTIRVRVTSKPPIKTYTNAKGEGKLFSVDLIDETDEIRATGFNQNVDTLYDLLQVGKTYLIRGGKVKVANKKFSALKNDYELNFDDTTTVTPADEDPTIPQMKCDFVPFSRLEATAPNSAIDVIAVATDIGPVATIMTKMQKEMSKRELTLMDKSGLNVTCTLWGNDAVTFEHALPAVVLMKGVRVSDFGGRSLSAGPTIMVNPDIPEAVDLLAWYTSEGKDVAGRKLSVRGGGAGGGSDRRIFLSSVKDEHLGSSDKGDYFSCKGAITFIKKDNLMYKACPSPDCQKKVIEDGALYTCMKCNKQTPTFKWRLLVPVNIADATGSTWLTAFQDVGETIFGGVTAEQLGDYKTQNSPQFDAIVRDAMLTTWMWRCRAKAEEYQGESRTKVTALSATRLDYRAESQHLIAEIKKYL